MDEARGRRSVLQPDQQGQTWQYDYGLVPRVDWRSWRTWKVFLGLWAVFGICGSAVFLLIAEIAARMIDDLVAASLTGVAACGALALFAHIGLKRAFPLRDETGAVVPGKPRLDLTLVPEAPLLGLVAFLSSVSFVIWAMVEAQDHAGAFSRGLPVWVLVYVAPLFMVANAAAFRILWRAPRQSEEGPGHG